MTPRQRLQAQLAFLDEVDRLKSVTRANQLVDRSRQENSAEHSWHLALYALAFADTAPDADIDRAILMLLLHDIVEIDAGDHPIHLDHDWAAVAAAEQRAADRLFGLLPADQGAYFRSVWTEFEQAQTPTAQYAKRLDTVQPMLVTLLGDHPIPEHNDVVHFNLTQGRARHLADTWPAIHAWARAHLDDVPHAPDDDLARRVAFLTEACRLKSVNRATLLHDGSRRENSGEHSWHVSLYAATLAEHAHRPLAGQRPVQMLLIHDLVEIDVGDAPIHGAPDHVAIAAAEQTAALRIFGLLPDHVGAALLQMWQEFEAAETDAAVFAKSIDRVQPLTSNLANGGGSWVEYNVTYDQLVTRVGEKVARGAPAVWDEMNDRILRHPWFANS